MTTHQPEPAPDTNPLSQDGVRIIVTKYETYILPASVQGIPVEEYFPDVVTWPPVMKNARVYETSKGPVITMPADSIQEEPARPDGAKRERSGGTEPG
jgi:hypothetical protein